MTFGDCPAPGLGTLDHRCCVVENLVRVTFATRGVSWSIAGITASVELNNPYGKRQAPWVILDHRSREGGERCPETVQPFAG